MKTQFGNDQKRDTVERRLRLISIFVFIAFLVLELIDIANGNKTWTEASKSDWIFLYVLIPIFPERFSFYASFIVLPLIVWLQLIGEPLSMDTLSHASWSVWLPVSLWLFQTILLLFLIFKRKPSPKSSEFP